MVQIIILVVALLPIWILLQYFIKSDKFPEPTEMLSATFWKGVKICFPVLIVELLITWGIESAGLPAIYKECADAFLCAAMTEEFFKFRVLDTFVSKSSHFDEEMDGIVYGAVASLGFAALENIMYSLSEGLGVAIFRAVSAVPLHAGVGAIMGYYYGKTHFSGKKVGLFNIGLILAILYHGAYDAFLMVAAGLEGYGDQFSTSTSDDIALYCVIGVLVTMTILYKHVRYCVADMQSRQIEKMTNA